MGRSGEEAVLEGCIASGTGVVAVSGDPGMGKSTLLAWAAERAAAAGMTVLAGRVGEFERSIPFGVFADALADHWTAGADLSAAGRHALHREVRALLERLGADGGLLLVLDDLHWADTASIELVHHLVRHRPRGVLVACAYRPRQLRLDCASVVHIELGPLALDDAAALLGVPAGQCGALFEAAGGNPFYLEALSGGSASVDAALRGEMDALRPQTRRLLQIAAVTADPFEPDLVAEVANLSVEETLGALDELMTADLVRPENDLRTYRFRHPTVRNVAYHSAPAAVRHSTHSRAALVLERLGAPAETRAHHVEHAARRGDHGAVAVLSSAAHDVVHRAPATAAHWFATALELSDEERWELRWGHARALGLSGRLPESRAALHGLLAVLPADHPDRLRVVAFCAHVERALGKHAEVRALAARELAIMTHDTASAAVLKLVLAVSLLQVLESADVITTLLDDVRAQARASGDTVLEAGANGVTALVGGDARHLGPAASAVDGATDQAVAERLESVVWVAWSELRLGRNRDALRHYERALSVALSTGQHHMLGNLLLGRANSLRWLGCLAEAEAGAEESAEVAYLSGSADLHALTLAVHSWLLTLRGDHVRGLEVARQAVDVARAFEGWHPTIARLRVGHALLAAGSHEAALFELTSAGGGLELPRVPLAYRPEMYELIVRAAIGAGEDAVPWATQASVAAESLGLPGCLGFADLAWAHVHAARGESATARASAAVSRFSSAGQRLEEAQAYLALGGEAGARRARALFAECGVAVLPVGDGLGTLTKRERQVAELVGEGLTNRQVARQLRMAEKTVEGHLSRIFAKLEVRSRAGVARVLASVDR
ncbi:AAA family ATPase [Lentzea tibetensis]|uniref:AAA family ATPase n=1 Tax=Lentzea tibetensis TaxID=2591470 RepID=UPI0016442442|nr:LuxR family transcriptional regulator [Lentzea tibetensis]